VVFPAPPFSLKIAKTLVILCNPMVVDNWSCPMLDSYSTVEPDNLACQSTNRHVPLWTTGFVKPCSTRAGGDGLKSRGRSLPDTSRRRRSAGRVKSAAFFTRRTAATRSPPPFAGEHGEEPPVDVTEHRGIACRPSTLPAWGCHQRQSPQNLATAGLAASLGRWDSATVVKSLTKS